MDKPKVVFISRSSSFSLRISPAHAKVELILNLLTHAANLSLTSCHAMIAPNSSVGTVTITST